MKSILTILCLYIGMSGLHAQKIVLADNTLEANNIYLSFEKFGSKKTAKVSRDSTIKTANAPAFAKIKDITFQNGTIEVKVLSRLLKTASPTARGFIGVAFRINNDNTQFECIYIRPTNGRADDQVRRNHSTQYYSYPDFSFDRLRKESPEKYESYADMGLNEWITLKIEVKGSTAKLFLNDNKQPSLIVNDLKLGENMEGGIGLWVDGGTEGFFRDLKIIK